jgi:hypothetical protein
MTSANKRSSNERNSRKTACKIGLLNHSTSESRPNESIETVWEAELLERAEEIKNGHAIGEPAQKVFSDLRAKYS